MKLKIFFLQTPIYLAVSTNQPAMVHKLIRYGADVNIRGMVRKFY